MPQSAAAHDGLGSEKGRLGPTLSRPRRSATNLKVVILVLIFVGVCWARDLIGDLLLNELSKTGPEISGNSNFSWSQVRLNAPSLELALP